MSTLRDIGERQAVELLKKALDRGRMPVGIGDDCAAINMGKRYLLVTTDVVNEGTHIPRGASGEQIGWYTVAVNLSDIAAMGGRPLGIVVAMTLPGKLEESLLQEIARGMDSCAKEFGIQVVGGDTKEGPEISLCGTAFGVSVGKKIIRRKGARVGDIVAVTGELGRGGWFYIKSKEQTDISDAIDLLMRPYPRIKEGLSLARSGMATSGMDISDGLASSLHQLSLASNVSFEIEFEKIPVFPLARSLSLPQRKECVLYHGGDFELLVTIKRTGWDRVERGFQRRNMKITAIGTVAKPGENVLISKDGREVLENRGDEHFRGLYQR